MFNDSVYSGLGNKMECKMDLITPILFVLTWNCLLSDSLPVIDLQEQCNGLDEDEEFAICQFSDEGIYMNLGQSSTVEHQKLDSFRNSKISLENLPDM